MKIFDAFYQLKLVLARVLEFLNKGKTLIQEYVRTKTKRFFLRETNNVVFTYRIRCARKCFVFVSTAGFTNKSFIKFFNSLAECVNKSKFLTSSCMDFCLCFLYNSLIIIFLWCEISNWGKFNFIAELSPSIFKNIFIYVSSEYLLHFWPSIQTKRLPEQLSRRSFAAPVELFET